VCRGRPEQDGCARAAANCVRTHTGKQRPTWSAPIDLSSLTCGNKSEPVTEITDDAVNRGRWSRKASRQVNELLSTLPGWHREIVILRLVVGKSARTRPWGVPRKLAAWLNTEPSQVMRVGERFG
jgi:hypothetical protein